MLKHLFLCLAVAALFTGNAAPGVRAEEPDPRFGSYISTPDVRRAVAKAIYDQVSSWPTGCHDIDVKKEPTFYVLSPVTFDDGAKSPKSGAWIEALPVIVCGQERIHNIRALAENGQVTFSTRLNGTTLASEELQNDAIPMATMGASLKAAGDCNQSFVIDTEFKDFEGAAIPNAMAGPQSRAWKEAWTVWSCGKEIVVPVVFTPDETGTMFSVGSSDATVKQ